MIVINLFAGPGAGKSTTAADLFVRFKRAGIVTELVTEYAKDLTYERSKFRIDVQPYVFANQLLRMERLLDHKVEIAITDSPLLLCNIYGDAKWHTPHFNGLVRECFKRFNNRNYYVVRNPNDYVEVGRNQTLVEAKSYDDRIRDELDAAGEPYSAYVKEHAATRIWSEYLSTLFLPARNRRLP